MLAIPHPSVLPSALLNDVGTPITLSSAIFLTGDVPIVIGASGAC